MYTCYSRSSIANGALPPFFDGRPGSADLLEARDFELSLCLTLADSHAAPRRSGNPCRNDEYDRGRYSKRVLCPFVCLSRPAVRCSRCGHGPEFIAIRAADVCSSLQIPIHGVIPDAEPSGESWIRGPISEPSRRFARASGVGDARVARPAGKAVQAGTREPTLVGKANKLRQC
jgi:hypothetical protein